MFSFLFGNPVLKTIHLAHWLLGDNSQVSHICAHDWGINYPYGVKLRFRDVCCLDVWWHQRALSDLTTNSPPCSAPTDMTPTQTTLLIKGPGTVAAHPWAVSSTPQPELFKQANHSLLWKPPEGTPPSCSYKAPCHNPTVPRWCNVFSPLPGWAYMTHQLLLISANQCLCGKQPWKIDMVSPPRAKASSPTPLHDLSPWRGQGTSPILWPIVCAGIYLDPSMSPIWRQREPTQRCCCPCHWSSHE